MPSLKEALYQIAIRQPYNLGMQASDFGEFIADGLIARDHMKQMENTGDRLVKTFGSGEGRDIDNYYHALLQCQLAKISERSRQNGLILGELKEDVWDLPKKIKRGDPIEEVLADRRKDLQNNDYGSIMGKNNPYISCMELLDDKRTPNMRKLNIR